MVSSLECLFVQGLVISAVLSGLSEQAGQSLSWCCLSELIKTHCSLLSQQEEQQQLVKEFNSEGMNLHMTIKPFCLSPQVLCY